MTRPKIKCTLDALLRFVAGFLVTLEKRLYFMYYYPEYIADFLMTCIKGANFNALLRGKAGFLMTCQNLLYLMN